MICVRDMVRIRKKEIHETFGWKTEGRGQLGRPWRRWEVNIGTDLE
jgi:hypothetical protein